jgi:hypothetical protein
LREAEAEIVQLVEREFATLPAAASLDTQILPWIGPWPYTSTRAEHKALVVRALLAKCWFEFEAPRWAQPLPLTEKACVALLNGPDGDHHRRTVVVDYARQLRGLHWKYWNESPFEVFCARSLSPPE